MKLIKNEQTEKNTVKLTIEVDKESFEKALASGCFRLSSNNYLARINKVI